MPDGLSVVVPYRNRPQCLARCLKPLLTQWTKFPYEVVLVDHASTDKSIAKYLDKHGGDPKLAILRYKVPTKFNLARARNIGILLSKYSLIYTLDVDSVFLKRHCINYFYHWWHWLNKKSPSEFMGKFGAHYLTKAERADLPSLEYRRNGVIVRTVGWGNCLFHKNVFYLVGGYDHDTFCGKGYEDMAFFLIAFRQGCYAVQEPKTKRRKKNKLIHNLKDHEIGDMRKRVEIKDEWEGGSHPAAKLAAYKKFREVVEARPKIMHNYVDFSELVENTERIICG